MKLFGNTKNVGNYVYNILSQTIWRLFFVTFSSTGFVIFAWMLTYQLKNAGVVDTTRSAITASVFVALGWFFSLIRQIHDYGNTQSTWQVPSETVKEQIEKACGK